MVESTVPYRELIGRISSFDPPPDTLDLLTASDAELRRFGIPPRPDRSVLPGQYEAWADLFDPRPSFLTAPLLTTIETFRTTLRTEGGGTGPEAVVPRTTRFESSPNWSGAYVQPNGDRTFLSVHGRWTVPDPTPPPGSSPPMSGTAEYAGSTWIGLDGQRLYLDSSLPQVGTFQSVTVSPDGSETFDLYAWLQWWARDTPDVAPVKIGGLTVEPGDPVVATVRVWAASEVVVYIKNRRTGSLAWLLVKAPVHTEKTGQHHTFVVTGATAQWIVERPLQLGSAVPFNFADQHDVAFTRCIAVEADPEAPGWPFVGGQNYGLTGARFIRMFDVPGGPPRIRFTSMPWPTGHASVRVRYGDSAF